MGSTGGPAPRRTGRLTVGRNITWTWTCVIALQITDPSSRQRGSPIWKKQESNCHSMKCKIWSPAPKVHDTKMNWPTDRRSQYNLNLYRKLYSNSAQRTNPLVTRHLFPVTLTRNIKSLEISKLNSLNHIIIKVELYRAQTSLTQCYKCQNIGCKQSHDVCIGNALKRQLQTIRQVAAIAP
jgi:hypothetical protein